MSRVLSLADRVVTRHRSSDLDTLLLPNEETSANRTAFGGLDLKVLNRFLSRNLRRAFLRGLFHVVSPFFLFRP
jgi:hypothetical protein